MTEPEEHALPLSRLSLNLGTLGPGRPLPEIVACCRRYGIATVSPWRYNYEDMGAAAGARMFRESGLSVNTVCRVAGFGEADSPPAWRAAIDEGRQILDEAATLGAASVTFIGGGLPAHSNDLRAARARVQDGIAALLGEAQARHVDLAVEPLHPMVAADRGCISSLEQAIALCIGPGTGVVVDCYNSWWDPQLERAISAAAGMILAFQVSDWRVPTTDLALDRGLMGDGIIDLRRLRLLAEAAGFTGCVEVEVLSRRLWSRDLDALVAEIVARFREHC
jgi:sugar phosphate isomerase/epimerase